MTQEDLGPGQDPFTNIRDSLGVVIGKYQVNFQTHATHNSGVLLPSSKMTTFTTLTTLPLAPAT